MANIRFNPPPGWPVPPPGWKPGPGWQPASDWPPAPPGWSFWVDAGGYQVKGGQSPQPPAAAKPITWGIVILLVAAVVAVVCIVAISSLNSKEDDLRDRIARQIECEQSGSC